MAWRRYCVLHTAQQISAAERGTIGGGKHGGNSSNYSRETAARRRRRWYCLVHTSGAPNEGIGKPNVHVDSSQAGRNARTHRNLEWEGKDVTVTQHRFTGLDFYLRQQVYILQFSSS